MNRSTLAFLAAGVALALGSAPPASAEGADTDAALLQFIGHQVAAPVHPLLLDPAEQAQVVEGFRRALAGEAVEGDANVLIPRLQAFAQARALEAARAEKERSAAFLAELAQEPGAETTPSGLVFIEREAGSGASPTLSSNVRVHYHGTLRDGSVFDSSVARGTPAQFRLGGVIACWQEGVARMKPGGKATLGCPSSIAYGDPGSPPSIPGGAALRFDVELIEVSAP